MDENKDKLNINPEELEKVSGGTEENNAGPDFNGAIHVDQGLCIECCACLNSCPVGAIVQDDSSNWQVKIDYNWCIGCRNCFDYCPVGAIVG